MFLANAKKIADQSNIENNKIVINKSENAVTDNGS